MKKATISLYEFNELNQKAREKAIYEHESFLLSIGQECENEAGEMETEYPETIEESEVIDSIEANEYLFFADGSMAHCTTYVGNHEKAGITELKFHGEIITL